MSEEIRSRIRSGARAIEALAPALERLDRPEALEVERAIAVAATTRGYFTPEEDDLVRAWFARYLTARAGLHEVIDDLRPFATHPDQAVDEAVQLRAFVVAYTAACLLVRAGRFLIRELAPSKVVQRKLNEPSERYRIPRKQYVQIHRSLTSPRHAWELWEAMCFADERRDDIDALAQDPELVTVLSHLRRTEDALRVDLPRYLKARLAYRLLSWRRRRASATKLTFFGLLEVCGRMVAELRLPQTKRVHDRVVTRLGEMLVPGDVIITRHDNALSNLFLPGYWPHVALHIGPCETCDQLGVLIEPERRARWAPSIRVLEARKDGVLFRPLAETLSVDAVAVLRPDLAPADLGEGLSRALVHEGKLYNFDFDFFTADRLVCTEVVYRAYDGVGSIRFELQERAGRLTFSAEDLISLAIEGRGFRPVAVFGTPVRPDELATGDEARSVLRTLRESTET